MTENIAWLMIIASKIFDCEYFARPQHRFFSCNYVCEINKNNFFANWLEILFFFLNCTGALEVNNPACIVHIQLESSTYSNLVYSRRVGAKRIKNKRLL